MIDRVLTVVSFGLRPPVPLELRSDYVQATPEEQAKHRIRYAIRHLRWARFAGAALGVLVVLKAWEFGAFVALGLGGGMAHAGDVAKVRAEVAAARVETAAARAEARAETASFRTDYKRDQLNAELRGIAAEEVQIQLAQAEATARGERPLALLATRLSSLRTRREELNRQLEELPKAASTQ